MAGSIIPVIIGASVWFMNHTLSYTLLIITAIGVAALHLGANLLNDYYDARGSDPINIRLTPFSGGSRVIQDNKMQPRTVLLLALSFFLAASSAGLLLVYLDRPLVLAFGLFGLAAGWAYSAPPLHLMSRGWGEILIFIAFGPMITMGTYYVMSGSLSWEAFVFGFPQGCFITCVILINQFPDYQADREAGKKNLVVRWGPEICRHIYCAIMSMAFVIIFFLAGMVQTPWLIMLTFISFPLAFMAMRILFKKYRAYEEIIPAQALTIQALIAHGLLLSVGLILIKLL